MIWSVIRLYWRPLAVATVLLAVATGIGLYGHMQHQAGYTAARAEATLAAVAVEQGMQYDRDEADARYRGAVLAREVAARDLVAVRGELDRVLRAHGRDAKAASTGRRSDDAGPDWIGGFSACYAAYADLAADAAGWADQVNGLQDYVKAVRSGIRGPQ